MEPRHYAWIIPERLAVAERPGGGGRSHRRERRACEIAWWRDHGVTTVVSAMRTRHGLADYADSGLVVRWHPLRDPDQAPEALGPLSAAVREVLETGDGAVLVCCDRPNEWLAGIDARLRIELGLARSPGAALRAAAADGLPVGSLATSIVGRPMSAA